jgi:hypothetical protein
MEESGTISSVEDHGTIIVVMLQAGLDLTPVYFDHRCFQHLLDGEGCSVDELIGRPASFDGEALSFPDGD